MIRYLKNSNNNILIQNSFMYLIVIRNSHIFSNKSKNTSGSKDIPTVLYMIYTIPEIILFLKQFHYANYKENYADDHSQMFSNEIIGYLIFTSTGKKIMSYVNHEYFNREFLELVEKYDFRIHDG